MKLSNQTLPLTNGARVVFVTVLMALSLAFSAKSVSADTFGPLLGSWGGSGLIRLTDGTSERLSCNAYYTGGGSALNLAIRCSSQTQKVEVRSKLSYANGRLAGHWEERTYNAEGDITGTASPGRLRFSISGTISGSMEVKYDKSSQNVSISTQGVALKSVNVKLTRK